MKMTYDGNPSRSAMNLATSALTTSTPCELLYAPTGEANDMNFNTWRNGWHNRQQHGERTNADLRITLQNPMIMHTLHCTSKHFPALPRIYTHFHCITMDVIRGKGPVPPGIWCK